MKRIDIFACMALGVVLAAGCDPNETKPEPDFPVVGDLSISGKYVTYMHGTQGWIEEDKIGVFVTSDGIEQSNLLYVPSEVCPVIPNKYVEGYFNYDDANYKDGDILLKAQGTAAGFKQGEHMIYAYTPYSEGNATHAAVKLPDLTKQDYFPMDGLKFIKNEYKFAYAKLAEPISEYSSATHSLGDFTSPFVQMTVPSPTFGDGFVDKSVTKIVISADTDIATKEATINLETGEISGTMSKSFEYVLPKEGLKIESSLWGADLSTLYLSLCIDPAVALKTDFTFTFTIDGTEYIATAKPAAAPISSEENINMHGQLTIE